MASYAVTYLDAGPDGAFCCDIETDAGDAGASRPDADAATDGARE
jgi:hypothetical protein